MTLGSEARAATGAAIIGDGDGGGRNSYGLTARQVDAAFPFHLVLDEHGHVLGIGSSLARTCPQLRVRDRFAAHFLLERPREVRATYEALCEHAHRAFILCARDSSLRLRGQIQIAPESRHILLLGSLWVTDFSELGTLGMSLGDLADHDPMADFLTLLQTQKTALNDARHLAHTLKERSLRLRQAKRAAEQAHRTKSQFVAMIGHELRTPLSGLIGLSEALADDVLSAEQRRDYARAVHESGQSLVRILNDLLDLSKLEAGRLTLHRESMDMRAAIRATEHLYVENARKKGLDLLCSVTDSVPATMIGDRSRIEQVLRNLVSNAIKFTDSGRVSVTVDAVAERYAQDPSDSASAPELLIEVSDTGMGIAPERIRQLFEPYTQADDTIAERFGGTGLGLAICRQLVEHMGGRIGARSAFGRGSVFWFRLPLVTEPRVSPEQQLEAVRLWVSASARRGLVVDDNRISCIVARRLLAGLDVAVEVVDNGTRAIASCARTDFDVVLLDIHLPDVSGIEVARRIGRDNGPLIVGVTGDSECDQPGFARENGLHDVIQKPLSREALVAALYRHIDAGS